MESRNFVAAREMAAGGSWLIPTINGELRLAKPPLPTWAVALVMRVAGPTENLALLRLPAAGMAMLLVLFFWGLSRELTRDLPGEAMAPGRTAWLAALVLATTPLLITSGREGQWDIFANSWMLGSLWALVRGWRSTRPAFGWFVGAGALLGLSFLSKGPVALYAMLMPFVVVSASRLNAAAPRPTLRHWRGALLALAVAVAVGGSWPAYVLTHVGPAARAVASVEVASWAERHVQPWYFYLSFPAFAGVWVLAAVAGLAVPYARRRVPQFVPYGLALGWLLATLLLLSAVPEKKARYLLPLLPPLALLVAGLLRAWEAQWAAGCPTVADRRLVRAWAGLLAVLALLLPVVVAVPQLPGFGMATGRFWLTAGLGVVLAGTALTLGWRGAERPAALAVPALGIMGALVVCLLPLFDTWEHRRDEPGLRRLTAARQHPALARLPWFSLNDFHITQAWKAGRAAPVFQPAAGGPDNLPVAVVSSSPVLPQLPAAWQGRVRAEVVDSFYTGRTSSKGRWLLTVLSRNSVQPGPPAPVVARPRTP